MRRQEAAYHMPYWTGWVQYDWEANTTTPFAPDNSTTEDYIIFRPFGDDDCNADKCVSVATTDDSLFTTDPTPYSGWTSRSLGIFAPGLWYWNFNIDLTAIGGSPTDAVVEFEWQCMDNGFGAQDSYHFTPNVNVPFGEFRFPVTITSGGLNALQGNGIFSWSGEHSDFRAIRVLMMRVEKDDAADGLRIKAMLYVCRFSPVGFFDMGGEC
jgi:hypothetical protein